MPRLPAFFSASFESSSPAYCVTILACYDVQELQNMNKQEAQTVGGECPESSKASDLTIVCQMGRHFSRQSVGFTQIHTFHKFQLEDWWSERVD